MKQNSFGFPRGRWQWSEERPASHCDPLVSQLWCQDVYRTQLKSPGRKDTQSGGWGKLQMQIVYLPQLGELWIQLFPTTIVFLSLMSSVLISKLLMKQAPTLWSSLLRLAGLNCFVFVTDRHSEQLDNNKEARWGNGLDSFILIMLIVHPTVLNQCWRAIFDSIQ